MIKKVLFLLLICTICFIPTTKAQGAQKLSSVIPPVELGIKQNVSKRVFIPSELLRELNSPAATSNNAKKLSYAQDFKFHPELKHESISEKLSATPSPAMSTFQKNIWPDENFSNLSSDDVDKKLRDNLINDVYPILETGFTINGKTVNPFTLNNVSFKKFAKEYPLLIYFADPVDNSREAIASSLNGMISSKNYSQPKNTTWNNLFYRWNHVIFKGIEPARNCFTDDLQICINAKKESINASMAHEVAHHYLHMTYPEIRNFYELHKIDKPVLTNAPTLESERICLETTVVQEAFCVYVEYLYLRSRMGKFGKEFTLADFIKDSLDCAITGKHEKRKYGIPLDYMICFLRTLDWEKLVLSPDEHSKHIPFNTKYLEHVNNMCKTGQYTPFISTFPSRNATISPHINNILELKNSSDISWIALVDDIGKVNANFKNQWNELKKTVKEETVKQTKESILKNRRKETIEQALDFIINHTSQNVCLPIN